MFLRTLGLHEFCYCYDYKSCYRGKCVYLCVAVSVCCSVLTINLLRPTWWWAMQCIQNTVIVFPAFFQRSFCLCLCVDIQQDAQLFLCLQWTSVSSKEPLLLWTAMPHTTPEWSSGTQRSPSLPLLLSSCPSWTRQCLWMYNVWNASPLQLSVGSRWQACPHHWRRPRLCASWFPDDWSDVVWGYRGLHLCRDVSSWQRFSHCTPRSYVSSWK